MASRVNIVQVHMLDNPAMFTDKFKLEIVFEVFEHLPHDLEWELVIKSRRPPKFVFDADHPEISKIPTVTLKSQKNGYFIIPKNFHDRSFPLLAVGTQYTNLIYFRTYNPNELYSKEYRILVYWKRK